MSREIKFTYTVVKPKITFSSDVMTIEEIEYGSAKRFFEMNGVLPNSHKVYRRRYTGLLDKNKAEIYEGDILRFINGRLYTIGFEYGRFDLIDFDCYGHDQQIAFDDEDDWEVVGNIYEHHHLLNKEPNAQVSDTTGA